MQKGTELVSSPNPSAKKRSKTEGSSRGAPRFQLDELGGKKGLHFKEHEIQWLFKLLQEATPQTDDDWKSTTSKLNAIMAHGLRSILRLWAFGSAFS